MKIKLEFSHANSPENALYSASYTSQTLDINLKIRLNII